MARGWNVARLTVVALLVWGAYWAALPWNRLYPRPSRGCADRRPAPVLHVRLRDPRFPAALGWNIVAGVLYVAAAIWAAARRS